MGEAEEIEILIPPQTRVCDCPSCEESRFIQRLQSHLPEAEANELGDWYSALRDATMDKDMDFYWIDLKLKDLQKDIGELVKKRTVT